MNITPDKDLLDAAARWFGRQGHDLDAATRRVIARAAQRKVVVDDPIQRLDQQAGFGERLADQVANFGGSWRFIILFGLALAVWVVLNSEILGKTAFDPYPYIFLNLMLSMLAALQAPVIMMSQNRQSAKDRQMASYDYEINLKAELEIMTLHEKMDGIRSEQLMEILARQQAQIDLLQQLISERAKPAPAADE